MKKLICILLILLLSSCSANTREYTIYRASSTSAEANVGSFKDSVGDNIRFEHYSKIDLDFVDQTEVSNENAPKQKELTLNGKPLTVQFTKSYKTSVSGSPIGKSKYVGLYDSYKSEGDNQNRAEASFRQNTGELLFYIKYGDARTVEDGDFTESLAKVSADRLISELYGEDTVTKYVHHGTSEIDTQLKKGFVVTYTRYIHGYRTNETITISFNRKGEFISLNALQMNLFDNAEKDISKSDIEMAYKALLDTISDSYEVSGEPKLFMDSSGKYYLNVHTVSKASSMSTGDSLYININ